MRGGGWGRTLLSNANKYSNLDNFVSQFPLHSDIFGNCLQPLKPFSLSSTGSLRVPLWLLSHSIMFPSPFLNSASLRLIILSLKADESISTSKFLLFQFIPS